MSEGRHIDSIEPDHEHKRRRWRAHIERWQERGLSQGGFAASMDSKRISSPTGKNDSIETMPAVNLCRCGVPKICLCPWQC